MPRPGAVRWSRRTGGLGVRRPVSTLGGEQAAEVAVALGVVGGAVVPEAPDDSEPGAAEDADCVWVVAAAGDRVGVDLFRRGVVVAAAVGEDADGVAECFVAGPAEAGDFVLAGLDRDGALAGAGFGPVVGVVAVALVADLGDQRGIGDDRFGVTEEG